MSSRWTKRFFSLSSLDLSVAPRGQSKRAMLRSLSAASLALLLLLSGSLALAQEDVPGTKTKARG